MAFQKGKKFSEEHKRKISQKLKGNKNHLGKPLSDETKRKIGLALRKQWAEGTRKPTMLGKHHSEETKRKISEANKGRLLTRRQKEKMVKALTGLKQSEKTRRKKSETLKGERNPNWKGGINPINDTIRNGIEFRLWRESVFARDNWTCQKCKEKGCKLHSHHIYNFSTYLDLRFAIDNGITFCKKCHKLFHKIYGNQNNKKQLEEFLIVAIYKGK